MLTYVLLSLKESMEVEMNGCKVAGLERLLVLDMEGYRL